jgi:hypothetical protein
MAEKTEPPSPNVIRLSIEEIRWFLRKFLNLRVGESTRAHVEASMRESNRRAAEVDKLMKEEWDSRKKREIGDGSPEAGPDVH